MDTSNSGPSISSTLFNKTQRGLLSLFFVRPEQSFYLRQIVRTAGIGQGAAQRELARWVDVGLLLRTQRGNQVHFQANPTSSVFGELKSLAIKTAGVADILREALAGLAEQITVAFIHGSMARGTANAHSDVDLVVVGEAGFGAVTNSLRAAQDIIGREVNPTVYPVREFRTKLLGRHHFVTSIMETPKIYLVGGEDELDRLGEKRLARRTPNKPARNPESARRRRT
ncbi:MAG: nucleotidyltransferase domain-containing protein [Planctomycetaceae bacterium]|nr:nucleotidyltransferase domain-containing protein [Planctomycetaceae bacterium]